MSVDLQPAELSFRRPFNNEVVQKLFLKNPHHDPVAFKVKTTAPKQYCVRPNSGRIEAGKEVEVQVLLQAMRDDPPPDFRCRDKFLVQSVPITADQEYSNVTQIWSDVEKHSKSSIQEKKIRVIYLPADPSATPSSNHIDNTKSPSPPPYSSPAPEFNTSLSPPVGPVSTFESRPDGHPTTQDAVRNVANPNVTTGVSETVSTVASTVSDQLTEARAQVAALTAQLKDSVQQKSMGELATDTKDKLAAGVAGIGRTSQTPEGVPVQLAAALCFAAFLLAYFFF